jgi:hypothetical protein
MPSQSSVGPEEGVDISNLDFRVQNKEGSAMQRGDLCVISTQQNSTTGRFNSIKEPVAGDLFAKVFAVALEPIADDGWGMVRVQGRVTHMKVGAATSIGDTLVVAATDKVVAANGSSAHKVVFICEAAATGANVKIAGIFDGWAGFGKDLVS